MQLLGLRSTVCVNPLGAAEPRLEFDPCAQTVSAGVGRSAFWLPILRGPGGGMWHQLFI